MMMLGRELTLPVDVLTEKPAEEGEKGDYAENLRDRLYSAHERARDKLKLASEHQAKMYDRNTMLRCYKVGDWVWLHGVERKRGVCPKLVMKWTGPYLITAKLSDVVYRIQLSERSKPKVVHLDRMKGYEGPPLKCWLNLQEAGNGLRPLRRNPSRMRRAPARYENS